MKYSKVADCEVHWNDNLLCAIDTETTGLDPAIHEVISIAIIPLNKDYGFNTNFLPFALEMAPRKDYSNIDPRAMEVNKLDLSKLINHAVHSSTAADLFVGWFENLKLKPGKKLMPLACNWPFDREFVVDWLGREHFNTYFDHTYRDIRPLATFIADREALKGEPVSFGKNNLAWLCNKFGVDNPNAHTALGDAAAAAMVYQRMLRQCV